MDIDVLVIGSGQAGNPLAARLAEAGRRTVLVERAELGGTCVNTGCTPTKTMIASATAAHAARTAARLGVQVDGVAVDLGFVVDRKEEVVEQWRSSTQKRLERAGELLTVVRGHARFVGPREVAVGDARYRAQTVVVNVGARPVVPDLPGLANVPWLTNRRLMAQRTLPDHLIVLGGGYVGCELGQMYRRFGAPVTIVEASKHLLAREDEEVSEALEEVLREEDITLRLGVEATGVSASNNGVSMTLGDGGTVSGSHLLIAVGRRPNTDDLGCDAADVRLDDRGFIVVDDHYRTSADGIYAVGDATGSPQFTHTSWDDHRILYDLLMGTGKRDRANRVIPHVAFTDPQVAGVGLTQGQAMADGVSYELASQPFGHVARAIETDRRAGTIRILVDPSDDRLLGATIVGAEAGELIHIVAVMMQAGATARDLVNVQIAHPAFAEGVQTALMKLPRFSLG